MPYKSDKKSLPDSIFDRRIKLLPCQREQIINMFNRGATYEQLARQYNVHKKTISNILNPASYRKELENTKRKRRWAGTDKEVVNERVKQSRKRKKVIYDIFLNDNTKQGYSMKYIVLAFTLKDQDFKRLAETIRLQFKGIDKMNTLLIHGFMPRKEVEAKGFDTGVVDLLDEVFPLQLNMYADGKPQRKQMAQVAYDVDADVVVVGHVYAGVAEEIDMYKSKGLDVTRVGILPEEEGQIEGQPEEPGELK